MNDGARVPNVLPTVPGDPQRIPGEARRLVAASCGAAPDGYYCLTHGLYLANRGQLDFHCETGRAHVVAKHCALHGPEAWPPAETDASLRPLDAHAREVAHA